MNALQPWIRKRIQKFRTLRPSDPIRWARRHWKGLSIGLTVWIVLCIGIRMGIESYAQERLLSLCRHWKEKRGIEVSYDYFGIKGLSTIQLRGLRVIPLAGDTLASAQYLSAKINLLPLILMRVDVGRVQASNIQLRFVKDKGYCNYNFLFKSDSKEEKEIVDDKRNYAGKLSGLLNIFFRAIPSSLQVDSLHISARNNGYHTELTVDNIDLNRFGLKASFLLNDSTRSQQWNLQGDLSKSDREIAFSLQGNTPEDTLYLPYFDAVYQANIKFNSLDFRLKALKTSRSLTQLECDIATRNLNIDYWRLADTTIIPGDLSLQLHTTVGNNYAELTAPTTFTLNGFDLHPYLKVEKNKDYKLTFRLDEKEVPAQSLVNALPRGMFATLEPLQIDGTFDYRLLTVLDFAHLDSLILEAGVVRHNLKIREYGELNKMNSPFLYTAYEKGVPVKSFIVGTESPGFRPLSSIAYVLQNAVLQSEDGMFYQHKGFSEKHFREALIHDIKLRRFARGGSTISMQLVKNVFLNRNKNIFRKVEEMAVVWLLENLRITSKARLFEVYLNIIEWGPSVYGAEEASRFYFGKSAYALTPVEAIFLASIVPHPKNFHWSFDAEGKLKENRFAHFRIVADRLARTGVITPEEFAAFVPEVKLSERALSIVKSRNARHEVIVEEENGTQTTQIDTD